MNREKFTRRDDEKGVGGKKGKRAGNIITRAIDYWLDKPGRDLVAWLQPAGQFDERKYEEQRRRARQRCRRLRAFMRRLRRPRK